MKKSGSGIRGAIVPVCWRGAVRGTGDRRGHIRPLQDHCSRVTSRSSSQEREGRMGAASVAARHPSKLIFGVDRTGSRRVKTIRPSDSSATLNACPGRAAPSTIRRFESTMRTLMVGMSHSPPHLSNALEQSVRVEQPLPYTRSVDDASTATGRMDTRGPRPCHECRSAGHYAQLPVGSRSYRHILSLKSLCWISNRASGGAFSSTRTLRSAISIWRSRIVSTGTRAICGISVRRAATDARWRVYELTTWSGWIGTKYPMRGRSISRSTSGACR